MSTSFCIWIVRKPHLSYNKDVVEESCLYDFDTVMASVVPYKYFRKYLATEHPDDLLYLRMFGLTMELRVLQKIDLDSHA